MFQIFLGWTRVVHPFPEAASDMWSVYWGGPRDLMERKTKTAEKPASEAVVPLIGDVWIRAEVKRDRRRVAASWTHNGSFFRSKGHFVSSA